MNEVRFEMAGATPLAPLKGGTKARIVKTTHPMRWEEVSDRQMEDVALFINGLISREQLVNSLLSLQDPFYNFPPEVYALHGFIGEPCKVIRIKEVKVGGRVFKGPADEMRDTEIGQFAVGDTYYIRFQRCNEMLRTAQHDKTKLIDESNMFLNRFLASFWIEGEYEQEKSKADADVIGRLPERTKLGMLMNYQLVRSWVFGQYGWLFPSPQREDEEILRVAQDDKKKNKIQSQWREFIHSLVNGDYVNEEKILKAKMHTVFYDMNERIKKSRGGK
jgi:hypothetical protein